MQEFTKTIDIGRPPEFVWPYLSESDKIQQVANFESIEQTPEGPVEKGTRWHQTMRMLGKKLDTSDEVIEIEEGSRLVMRSVDSPFPYTLEYILTGTEDGTDVVCMVEMGETGGFFGKFTEPVVARLMEHEFRAQLERLKALVEAADA
jgi:ligand-binding SRPBCC domain-containing protein